MSEHKPCFMCDPSILEQGQRCATGAPICDRHRDQLTGNMRPPTAPESALTAAQATIAQLEAQVAEWQREYVDQGKRFSAATERQIDTFKRLVREKIELRDQLAARDAQVAELTAALSDLLSAFVLHRTATHKTRPEYCETCQQGQAEIERAGALLARTPAAPEGETASE